MNVTRMNYLVAAGVLLLGVSANCGAATQADQAERMRHLAGERGCTVCHRDTSPAKAEDPATPLAPSWHEIAQRYRGQRGAEAHLASIVEQGADTTRRHWRNRLEFATMQGNEQRVSPEEARALVHWILSAR
jgi:cytochrome c551/c552